jgi:hypothetical protein
METSELSLMKTTVKGLVGVVLVITVALATQQEASAALTTETSAGSTTGTAQMINAGFFTPNADPEVFGTLPTVSIDGSIETEGDIDFYSFQATAGGSVYFDIDLTGPLFDTHANQIDSFLSLFNSSGTLIGYADNSPPVDPGSDQPPPGNEDDSFLGVFALSADDTYYIAVSDLRNRPTALGSGVATGLIRPDGAASGGFAVNGATAGDQSFTDVPTSRDERGFYRLHISLSQPGGNGSSTTVPEALSPWFGACALLGLLGGVCVRERIAKKVAV